MTDTIATFKAEIGNAQKSGDYLKEYDLAQAALQLYPDEEFFRYSSALALARCNAKQRALDYFYSCKLHQSGNEYVRSLEARILKDLAFQSLDKDNLFQSLDKERFSTAAVTYHRELAASGGHYSAVNAATLYLFSGDSGHSRELAGKALELADRDEGPQYYALATKAEAYLLLDRPHDARQAIAAAAQHNRNNLLTRARTHRQLKLICDFLGIDSTILAPLLPETVIHYCGHAFYNHHPISEEEEHELRQRIEAVIATNHCAVAYGSLMAGSDILFAEAILKQGGELNIWLPCGLENFCEVSVRPAGEDWVERFHACIKKANTVSCATESDFLGDDSLFNFCSDVAMGMAIMRANSLSTRLMQLAVWDRNLSSKSRGTYLNIEKWKGLGHHSEIIPSPTITPKQRSRKAEEDYPVMRRETHAILFSDVRGYSKLSDRDILWYFNELQPALAAVLDEFKSEIQHLDTWGDAIFLVTEKATTAAKIAVALNTAIAEVDQSRLNLDEPLLMRIGLHYGPVYKLYDHLCQGYTYSSNDVNKTARIEPVTPPGEIFGTEPFVAMLELEGEGWANFDYAGTIHSAKDYGAFRMFHIRTRYRPPALVCTLER
ncbi:MAG: adenylate/guanylate cyclase domain-containing protein [Nitrosomonadales bacterium]|nr:adenylate/guanylate cyclase domain-containing protein [Nitrosomonadales bacterium]